MQIVRLFIAGVAVGFWFAMDVAREKIDEHAINYHWQLCGYIYASLAFYGTLCCFVLPDFMLICASIICVASPFIVFIISTLHIVKCVEFNDNPTAPYKVYNLGQWVEFIDSPSIICTSQYCTTYLYNSVLCVVNSSDLDDVYVVGILNYDICRTRGTYTIDGFVFVCIVAGGYAVVVAVSVIILNYPCLEDMYFKYCKK